MTSRFAIPTFGPTSGDDSTDLHKSWPFSDEDAARLREKRRVAVRTERFLREVRTFVWWFGFQSYRDRTISDIFKTVYFFIFSMLGYMDLLKVFT